MIAVVRSIQGDHKQALDDLERLFPMAQAIGKYYPAFYYEYLNSLAIELGEVGRINEVHRVCRITLASPFAAAYSEFTETHNEIEAKRTCATPLIISVSAKPEPETQSSPEFKPVRVVAFIQPARETDFFQTSIAVAVTAIARMGTTASILDRVRYSIYTSGPPVYC